MAMIERMIFGGAETISALVSGSAQTVTLRSPAAAIAADAAPGAAAPAGPAAAPPVAAAVMPAICSRSFCAIFSASA